MKKLLLTGSLILASLALASAQGTIKFNNTTASFAVSTNGTGTGLGQNGTTTGATDKGAGDYFYELLYDTSTPTSSNPLTGGWTSTGLMASNSTSAIFVAGSVAGPGGAAGTPVSQVAPGGAAYFEVVGWSASLNGLTLAQMLAENNTGAWTATGYFGFAASLGAITLGGNGTPAAPATALFGGPEGIQTGIDLNGVSPTPEPATIALAGLGGMALLALRRKK
jgi:hypothetical protein